MILFYQNIVPAPCGSSIVAKCAKCHKEYPGKYRTCCYCQSTSREWTIDLFDRSHKRF